MVQEWKMNGRSFINNLHKDTYGSHQIPCSSWTVYVTTRHPCCPGIVWKAAGLYHHNYRVITLSSTRNSILKRVTTSLKETWTLIFSRVAHQKLKRCSIDEDDSLTHWINNVGQRTNVMLQGCINPMDTSLKQNVFMEHFLIQSDSRPNLQDLKGATYVTNSKKSSSTFQKQFFHIIVTVIQIYRVHLAGTNSY